jgi:sugar lactone lactonase YvrE
MPFRTEAPDLGFPEGPVALPDGGIAFVDLQQACVRRWRDGRLETIAQLPGAPNGMCLGADGALYVANNGGVAPLGPGQHRYAEPMIDGCIQRVGMDGSVTTLTTDIPGEKPCRPNDLIFLDNGDLVFTDSQNWEDIDFTQLQPDGSVPGYGGGRTYRRDAQGRVQLLRQVSGFANGLVLHPDGSLLVALTLRRCIIRLAWTADGLGEPEPWCSFDDDVFPDGLCLHGERLYVAASLGAKVAVVDLQGRRIDSMPCAGLPTNLCVSQGRLWVTAGLPGQLLSAPLQA